MVRRGSSLLEVLIAIFVVLVGLLGVAALVFVGGHKGSRGASADTAAAVGHEAQRTFTVRQWQIPRHFWTAYDATQNQWVRFAEVPNIPVAIDPRLVARHGSAVSTFPYTAAGNVHVTTPPTMVRCNLFAAPYTDQTAAGQAPPPMGVGLADHLFVSQDDLVMLETGNADTPAIQITTDDPSNPNLPATQRRSHGRYSWMATIVPQLAIPDRMLSIVVFRSRDVTAPHATQERVVAIQFLGGAGGGQAVLTYNGPQAGAKAALELRADQWLLVGATVQAGTQTLQVWHWYRAVHVSAVSGSDTTFTRNVTLAGPDWSFGNWVVTGAPQAVLMDGIVAVYERPISLEQPSRFSTDTAIPVPVAN